MYLDRKIQPELNFDMYCVYMIVKEKRKSTLKEAQFIFFFSSLVL